MADLEWTLARLRHVRLREVPYRLSQLGVAWTDARRRLAPCPPGPPPRWPVIPTPASIPDAVASAAQGDAVPAGGATVAGTDRIAFDRDPVSGRAWPDAPSLLGGDDPRPAWELSRLQHLALLAAVDPADPRPTREARALVEGWPPGRGLPWASALEVALRLISLVRIATARPEAWLRGAVRDHAEHLRRHPSLYGSANNHRVGELAGLALAAAALPDLPEAARWAREVRSLPAVLAAQLHPDGVGVEQSPGYLAFDVECALLARACGVSGLDAPIGRAIDWLQALLDEGGHAPAIGDHDDGRVLAIAVGPEPRYLRSVVGAAAAALGRPAPLGWAPDLRSAWLGLGDAPGRAAPPSACFPHGGLTALRRDGLLVVFDHGPLGGPPLAAHGHADALSVWVHVDGRPLIVDRGTGRYQGDPATRRFHRGTGAHPTVRIDGADQSLAHDHPFLWRRRAEAWLEAVDLDAGVVRGACRTWRGPVHRRTVRVAADRVVLEDRVDGVHHLALTLPLPPEAHVDEGLRISVAGREVARIEPDPRCVARVVRGGPRPGPGWHSPAYGTWVPAPAVVLEARPADGSPLVTVLHLSRR